MFPDLFAAAAVEQVKASRRADRISITGRDVFRCGIDAGAIGVARQPLLPQKVQSTVQPDDRSRLLAALEAVYGGRDTGAVVGGRNPPDILWRAGRG